MKLKTSAMFMQEELIRFKHRDSQNKKKIKKNKGVARKYFAHKENQSRPTGHRKNAKIHAALHKPNVLISQKKFSFERTFLCGDGKRRRWSTSCWACITLHFPSQRYTRHTKAKIRKILKQIKEQKKMEERGDDETLQKKSKIFRLTFHPQIPHPAGRVQLCTFHPNDRKTKWKSDS